MLGFKGEAHTVQRVRQREGAHASAFEEHRASSSESCDTLTLWHCDFMTPRPILSLSSSLSPPLSLLLSQTHIQTYSFPTPTCGSYIRCWYKKTNKKKKQQKTDQSFLQGKHTGSGTLIQSHTSGDARTHCQVPHTLSNLMQPRGKKAAEEKDRGKKPKKFSIFPFPGKRRTRKHCFQELLVARGPVVHACTYTHTHTLPAPLGASKTPMNAQSKIYSSEKQQPKAFQGRQLGCRACGLTKKACRLQLELTS